MNKILVIDDKHDNLVTIKALLKRSMPNVNVITAQSGPDGLKLAREEQPDAILLDIKMPDMDGYEVCRRLKADPELTVIPVIMLTAIMTDNESRIKGLELGADAFLSKPVNGEELVAQINVMLRIKTAEDALREERDLLEARVQEKTLSLQESEAQLRNIFENSTNLFYSHTPEHEITYLSPQVYDILGYTQKEAMVKWTDLASDDPINEIGFKNTVKAIETGERQPTYELELVKKNGEKVWVEVREFPIVQNGKTTAISGSLTDITERKLAEDALKENEQLLRLSTELANVAAWEFDFTTNSMSRSKNHDALYGLEFQEKWAFETFLNATHPDDREMSNLFIQNSVAPGGPDKYKFDFRIIRPDQSIRWLNVIGEVSKRNEKGEGIIVRGFIIDITDRKLAEEALSQSEEKFSVIFRKAPFSAALSSIPDLKLTEVNEQFEKYWGYSAAEAVGKTPEELGLYTDLNDRDRLSAIFREKGFIHDAETKMGAKSGELKDVLINSDIVTIGKEQFILSTVQDITERKKLEIERQKFFLLAESSSEFIGMCDLEMNPLYVNPAGRRMVGLPDMEAACRVKVQDYYFPEDQQFIAEDFFPRVLRDGHGDVEIRLRHFQTGEAIWMYYYLFRFQDDSGTPIGWATVSRDITERRRAEVALREREQEFRDLAESMPQIVWATRADGWNIYFNQQWVDYTGMTLEESYGHGWNKPFHPDDQQGAWDAWQNAVNSKGTYSIESRLRRFDGEYRWWLVRGVPQLNEQGEILKWFGTCTDIEEMKQVEEELKRHRKNLEELVHERTSELEKSLKEVERMNELFVGREFRIKELREKVKDLEQKLK